MKSRIVVCLAFLLAGICASPASPQGAGETADTPSVDGPKELGLTERTERKLVQIDVSVEGPRDSLTGLAREDFELVVGGKYIEEFIVDDLCALPLDEPDEETPPAERATTQDTPATPAPPGRTTATYLFYFDQHHMTMAGRQNALDTARELIPQLIHDGNRALVISSGKDVVTFAELSEDPQILLNALDKIEADRHQSDPFPYLEANRVTEVLTELRRENGSNRAITLAREYQQEERWRTEKALRIFSAVLGRLTDLPPPKAAIYFADTMRSNAGAHYLGYFGKRVGQPREGALASIETDAFTAANPFDRLVEEAAAHGIRLYTVQAEGMATDDSPMIAPLGEPGVGVDTLANSRRLRDAQNSLAGLANETGGKAYLNGVRGRKIAQSIEENLSCIYLLSFDGAALPENRPLPVRVTMDRRGVRPHARGQIFLQSRSKQQTARLFAAFAAPTTTAKEIDAVVIPTGYTDGEYSALVQISVPALPLPEARWELGASVVSRGKVREETAGRINVDTPGVPVIYETEMRFAPGPYELIAVAHEGNTDAISSRRFEGEWPDPDDAPASFVPFIVLQPEPGAFLREGRLRENGARALPSSEMVKTELPTALIGLVCRGRSRHKAMRVERKLVGETAVEFPALAVEFGDDRCVLIQDRIPPGTMTSGNFDYEIRALRKKEQLADTKLTFPALDPDERSDGAPAGAR